MQPSPPSLLRPHVDVSERVIAPGDPGRALRLAQWLLEGPKMLNHHRGLWGYTGIAEDGLALTIQSTGLGGPGAAAVVAELIGLGARRIVRVGAARGGPATALGDSIAPEWVLGHDGTSRALPGASEARRADRTLHECLAAGGGVRVETIQSVDLLYRAAACEPQARATDLASAALLAAAQAEGASAACVVAITALETGERLEDDGLAIVEEALGRLAVKALAS